MKKLLLAILTTLPLLCLSAEKSRVLENYSWPKPNANTTAFHLIWLGEENSQPALYAQVGEYYARVHFAPKQQLGEKYAVAKNKKISLFYRKLEDGKEYFEKAATFNTPSNSLVLGIIPEKEKLETKVADISFENIPIGSSAIINLSPYRIGATYKNKPHFLDSFEIWKADFPMRGKYKMGLISIFDIRKKPKLMIQRMLGGTESERAILYVFSTNIPESESIPLDTNQILPVVEN